MPRVIVGMAGWGSVLPDRLAPAAGRKEALRYLDEVLALGCTAFDLAASYMVGGTERLFGEWLRTRRNRDGLYLVSKGGHPVPIVAPHRLTARDVTADLHATLRRLGTDHVDLYLLHRDDESAALEPLVASLAGHVKAGTIGAWGVSNWTAPRIRVIDAVARGIGAEGVAASSPHFSLFDWARPPFPGVVSIAGEAGRSDREHHRATQLPVLAWSPLAHGFATGRNDDAAWATPANRERRRRVEQLARELGVSVAEVALAYVLCQEFPVAAIVATRTARHMEACLGATGLRLTPAQLRWLEAQD